MAPKVRHGHATAGGSSHTYVCWSMMKQRCLNPKATGYWRYGGAGITVCEQWMKFEKFLADIGQAPTIKHSLDRWPNKTGNYEPGNVRWATQTQQMRNARLPPGKKLTVEKVSGIRQQLLGGVPRKQIAADAGVSLTTVTEIAIGRTWKGR